MCVPHKQPVRGAKGRCSKAVFLCLLFLTPQAQAMLKRTLSKKFSKEEKDAGLSYFIAPDGKTIETVGPASSDATRGGKRSIKARVKLTLHGVQNVPSGSGGEEVALLSYKRGSKKTNAGKTAAEPVIFGMATWKHTVEFEVTFFQDKVNRDVEEKPVSFGLSVGPRKGKPVSLGVKVLDIAEFYRDGTRVDKIIPLTQGSNPVTLKLSIETRWTHIDNKQIVRGKSPRGAKGGKSDVTEEDSYDLKTVTFDSEDEVSVAGEQDFSQDEEDDGPSRATATSQEQTREINALKRELEELKGVNEQLKDEAKRADEKIETYRNTVKTKNDQIADLKTARDEKAALFSGSEARVAAVEDRAVALQAKLEAVSQILKDREEKNEADRQRFERELRELRARNEELHGRLTVETASNAQFLSVMEKQASESAAALKEEKAARLAAEQEVAQVVRREQSLVAELEEVLPEDAVEAIGPAATAEVSGPSPSSKLAGKDIGGAVIDVIRSRRKADRQAKEKRPSTPKPQSAVETSAAELNALKEQNRALAAEVKLARADCELHKAEVAGLKDKLASQTSVQESDAARLLNDRDTARRRLQEAEARLRELEKEAQAAKEEMEALKKRNESLAASVRESLEARAVANFALLEVREAHSKMAAEISAKQRDLMRTATLQASNLEHVRSQAATQLQEMEVRHVAQTEALKEEVGRLEKLLATEREKATAAAAAASSGGGSVTPRDLKPGTVVDAAVSLGKEVAGSEAAGLREHYRREKMELERIAERAKEDSRRAEDDLVRMERRANNADKAVNEARRAADEAKSKAADAMAQLAALKEQSVDREQALQKAEKDYSELSRQAASVKSKLAEREQLIEQLELRVASLVKAADAATQQLNAVEKRAAVAEQAWQERDAQHKTEVAAARDRLTEARNELRKAADKGKAAEFDRDAASRRAALLDAELKMRAESETVLSDELAVVEGKLRAANRALAVAEENLAQERARMAQLAAEKEKSASLEVEVEAKATSLQELAHRLSQAETLVKQTNAAREQAVAAEQKKGDALQAQIVQLTAAEAAQKREVQRVKEELRAASEQSQSNEELLQRKNAAISSLEAEVQATEAELAQAESQLSVFKRQAAERNVEAQSQRDRADAAAALAEQLRGKLEHSAQEASAAREAQVAALAAVEAAATESKRAAKEALQSVRALEQERETLRHRISEADAQLRYERTKMEELAQTAERVPELEEELASAQEANRTAEKRLKQLRESSGELGEKVEQLVALEKERRERKLVISCVLLGASDDNAKELVARSAKTICESLVEWQSLSANDGDSSCLTKIANGYQLLLQSSVHSYYHCIRVLSLLCSLSKALRQTPHELNINDPSRTGVISTADRSAGAGAVDEFVAKLEGTTEKAFVAVGEAIFRRVSPYLAAAILNHMPAQDENRIEETVVDSGNERGKFMSHTVLSTLTDARDWMVRYGLPEALVKQLFVTLMHNLNAYLFQYLIQTPSICKPTNAFTIKTRLGLLSDWFAQERNFAIQEAYKQLRPLDEAVVLLFVDRSSFANWDTIRALCPALNALQVLSLVEMLDVDETQKQALPQSVRDSIDQRVIMHEDNQTLFFRPKSIIPLANQ